MKIRPEKNLGLYRTPHQGAEMMEIQALAMPPQEQEEDHEGEDNIEEDDLEYDTKL